MKSDKKTLALNHPPCMVVDFMKILLERVSLYDFETEEEKESVRSYVDDALQMCEVVSEATDRLAIKEMSEKGGMPIPLTNLFKS